MSTNYDEELSNGPSTNANDDAENYSDNENGHSEGDSVEKSPQEKRSSSSKKSSSKNSSSGAKEAQSTKTRYIWVSGIPGGTKTLQLEDLFRQYGNVLAIKIIRGDGDSLLGFVKLETVEEAQTCMEKLNKSEFRGSKLELFKERPQSSEPKVEKIGFRSSRIPPRPVRPPIRPKYNNRPAYRPSNNSFEPRPRGHDDDNRRKEKERILRLERENERLKIERIKLEREREEMIRPRAFEDKRVRSSLYPDEKRFDEFRRDDFSHRLDSRSSPDRRNRFQTQAPFSSVRSRVENRGTDRFSDKYDVPKPSWPPVDNSWVSSGDRWQSSSYGIQSRMMPNSLDSLSRPDSTFAPRSSYFSGNNRRY